jgi:hypothetical protein
MGLDMTAFKTGDEFEREVDFDVEACEVFHRWRKHPNLHGWMKALYYAKGGSEAEFNLVNVALNKTDLQQLEEAIICKTLPATSGFFFGQSDGSEAEDDLEFIAKAREALNAGLRVFYRPWW